MGFSQRSDLGMTLSGSCRILYFLRNVQVSWTLRRCKNIGRFAQNHHFSWQARCLVILSSLLMSPKPLFRQTVVIFASSFGVTGATLRMPWDHFFGKTPTLEIAKLTGTDTSGDFHTSFFLRLTWARRRFAYRSRNPLQTLCELDCCRLRAVLIFVLEKILQRDLVQRPCINDLLKRSCGESAYRDLAQRFLCM